MYRCGKIYKLVSKHTDRIYIGSTFQPLTNRVSQHRSAYKTQKAYVSSFVLFELGPVDIELIEEHPDIDPDTLHQREAYYVSTFAGLCVNKNNPHTGLSAKEYMSNYQRANVDKLKQYNARYYLTNTRMKTRYECECGGRYLYTGKSNHFKSKKHQSYFH